MENLTDKTRPHQLTLLNEHLALWWDPVGERWNAVHDTCPHRMAPLSEGRIDKRGCIECPYHGWAFSGDGTCVSIPQQDDPTHAPRAAHDVRDYPVEVSEGIIWAWAGGDTEPSGPPPQDIPPGSVATIDYFRDAPADYESFVENLLDLAHIPFVHHRAFGGMFTAGPLTMTVADRTPPYAPSGTPMGGLTGVWQGPDAVPRTVDFAAPQLVHYVSSRTLLYVVPSAPGRCRFFLR
ncbi:Rieske [2Fe-2S] iron-sulfur domain-containing protein, partial [Tribonema minus]